MEPKSDEKKLEFKRRKRGRKLLLPAAITAALLGGAVTATTGCETRPPAEKVSDGGSQPAEKAPAEQVNDGGTPAEKPPAEKPPAEKPPAEKVSDEGSLPPDQPIA